MTLLRPRRLAAPALIGLLAFTAACATRTPTTQSEAAPTTPPAATNNQAAGTQTQGRALPPVAQGGTVDQRQTASLPAGASSQYVDPNTRAMAASIAEIGERVFFETDSYTLSPDARTILERQAAWMQGNPSARFMIAGNADERGTREYNLALGARRANAVRDYLISLGIAPSRLETVSYGKERPIDPRPTPDGWAMNRNAQTVVLGGQ